MAMVGAVWLPGPQISCLQSAVDDEMEVAGSGPERVQSANALQVIMDDGISHVFCKLAPELDSREVWMQLCTVQHKT